MRKKLTDKQTLFVKEYLCDLNAKQAAIRSGYTARSAVVTASKLLTKANVAEAIAVGIEERAEAVKIDANYILSRLSEIDAMSVRDILTDDLRLKPLSEWPESWCRYISSIDLQEIAKSTQDAESAIHFIKKIKWPDKIKNLELIGKHVDVQAFKDRVDHLHKVTLEDLVVGASGRR